MASQIIYHNYISSIFPTYSYNVSAGHYQCYDKLKAIWPSSSNLCNLTNWPGSWFATAVLGCRSLDKYIRRIRRKKWHLSKQFCGWRYEFEESYRKSREVYQDDILKDDSP